ARSRWLWAYGRVCDLLHRRKRKDFEIMSQRATDKAIRMGSRVSVIEKRMTELSEQFIGFQRLWTRADKNTNDIIDLRAAVRALSNNAGIEDMVKKEMKESAVHMEGMVRTGDEDLETKLKSVDEDLEMKLEEETRRREAKLAYIDERFVDSELAMKRAEENMIAVQEEV
ncbi:unnamed protein product, partial [Choristocarpus tenellus]